MPTPMIMMVKVTQLHFDDAHQKELYHINGGYPPFEETQELAEAFQRDEDNFGGGERMVEILPVPLWLEDRYNKLHY